MNRAIYFAFSLSFIYLNRAMIDNYFQSSNQEHNQETNRFIEQIIARDPAITALNEFICAAGLGDIDELKRLKDQFNIDLNAKFIMGNTALMCAAENGRVECVRYLLKEGVLIDQEDHLNRTALYYAVTASRVNIELILLLYEAEANLEKIKDQKNWYNYLKQKQFLDNY